MDILPRILRLSLGYQIHDGNFQRTGEFFQGLKCGAVFSSFNAGEVRTKDIGGSRQFCLSHTPGFSEFADLSSHIPRVLNPRGTPPKIWI